MKKILFFLLLISTVALSQPYNGAPKLSTTPQGDESGMLVRQIPQDIDRIGFTKTLSNSVDSDWGTIVGGIGSGMDVDQTGGNLIITAGTTTRAETIIRSTEGWTGGVRLRVRSTLSQRNANNNFFVELVDVRAVLVGDENALAIAGDADAFGIEAGIGAVGGQAGGEGVGTAGEVVLAGAAGQRRGTAVVEGCGAGEQRGGREAGGEGGYGAGAEGGAGEAEVNRLEARDPRAGVIHRRVPGDGVGAAVRRHHEAVATGPGDARADTAEKIAGDAVFQRAAESGEVGAGNLADADEGDAGVGGGGNQHRKYGRYEDGEQAFGEHREAPCESGV